MARRSLTDLPAPAIMKISWQAVPTMTNSAVTLIAAENRLVWHLGESTVQVDHVRWDQQTVTLEARGDIGAGILVEVTATHPFELEVEAGAAVFYESVPAGRTRFVLTYLDRGDVRQV